MKKLLYLLAILCVVGVAGVGATSWWIMQKMGPEIWVEQAEKNWNCRAHIDNAQLSLMTKPATLKFKGVKLAPRDLEVGKPYASRAPIADNDVLISVPEITLEVKLDDLLNRRLFVEHLRIIEPHVREVQDDQGKSSLEALFKKPGTVEAAEATPKTEPKPPAVESKAAEKTSPAFTFAMQSASLEKGRFDITSGTTQVAIQNLNFSLTGVDVDPKDLANHNKIQAKLSSQIDVTGLAKIQGVKQPAQLAKLTLSGEGDIMPYHPQTGVWRPATNLVLTLAKDSVLAGHLTIGDAAGKNLKKLEEYGIDLAPVRIGGPLMEDAIVSGIFVEDRFITRTQTRFVFPEYDVSIEPKSWVNSAQDRHEIELKLSCGPTLQTRLEQGIANAKLGESLTRGVVKALADERGRMTFDLESTGSLSDPKVKPKVDRVFKNLLRGEGVGDLLEGLLKKL